MSDEGGESGGDGVCVCKKMGESQAMIIKQLGGRQGKEKNLKINLDFGTKTPKLH